MVRTNESAVKPAKPVAQCFGSGKLIFHKNEHKVRYCKFKHTPIIHPYSWDFDAIRDKGLEEEINSLLSKNLWRCLLVDFDEPIYPDLVHETLTTL